MHGRRHAILVGVEKYTHFADTPFCHADVDLLADVLTSACDYDTAAVKVLKLAPGDGNSPLEIVSQVESLVSSTDPGSTLLFYFAGHGTLAAGVPYLVLPESSPGDWGGTAIALADVANRLRQDDRNCFRILDACHSGADVRAGLPRGLDSGGFMRAALAPGQGWATLAACAEDEQSHVDPAKGNGAFTAFLCDAIRRIESGKDVHFEQIKLTICDDMRAWCESRGYSQRPTLNASLVGNVSFATRVTPPTTASTSNSAVSASDNTPRSINDRLAAARRLHRLSEDHREELESAIGLFREELLAAVGALDWIGEKVPNVRQVDNSNAMPPEIKDVVVPHVRGTRMLSQHDYETEVERENNPFRDMFRHALIFPLMSEPKPRIVAIHHTIKQNGFPPSFVGGEIQGDGVIPDAVAFGYLIPLQASVCLLVGCLVRPVGSASWDQVLLQQHVCGLSDNKSRFASAAKAVVSALEVRVRRETEKAIDYLEWECRQAGLQME